MTVPYPKPGGDYMLVPTEPTTEMINAYDEAREATTLHTRVDGRPIVTYNPHQSYWAMLAAAPEADPGALAKALVDAGMVPGIVRGPKRWSWALEKARQIIGNLKVR